MRSRFAFGATLRVTRNVRNDGTFPGAPRGELLVRRGSVGTVIDIGTFLQDQIIYSVHFLDIDRIVGCREEELIGADEPWTSSLFESREKVMAAKNLVVRGELRAAVGSAGEVLKVLRGGSGEVQYEVIFGDRVLCVPEGALEATSAPAAAIEGGR